MMTIEQIKTALKDRRIPMVSEATGLHHNTIALIRDGETKNPSHRVVELLAKYFEEEA